MKTIKLLGRLTVIVMLLTMAAPGKVKAQSREFYAFIVVDGIWKDKVGYTSGIIQYKGYSDCYKYEYTDFFAEAKRAFSNHLKAKYPAAFPYGENNNFERVDTKKYSTASQLLTYEQARQRLNEWIADQKEKGYSVIQTTFGFGCENLK